jgi:selenophosphate synthase
VSVPEEFRHLLFDPQTSGGLLVAIEAKMADGAIAALAEHDVTAHRMGRVVDRRSPLLEIA